MPGVRTALEHSIQMAAIALIAGFIMYFAVSRILVDDMGNSLTRFAEQGATTVDAFLEGHISTLSSIAANSTVRDTGLPLSERLAELRKQLEIGRYKRLSIADRNGNSETTDGIQLQVGDREYFKKALRGEANVSDPLKSRADGTMVIAFAVPLTENGVITGVLYATYDAEELSRMTDKIKLSSKGTSYILSRTGYTIAHDDRNLVYQSDNILINVESDPRLERLAFLEKKMIAGEKGSGDYFYNGQEKYMGFSPIGNTGWSLAVTAPKNELFGKLNVVFLILGISVLSVSTAMAIINTRSRLLKDNLLKQQISSTRAADVTNLIAFTVNYEGLILDSNRYGEKFLNYFNHFGTEKVDNFFELLTPDGRDKLECIIVRSQLDCCNANFELALKRADSGTKYLYCSTTIDSDHSSVFEILGVDISERVEQQIKLQESFEELTMVYEELANTEEKVRQLAYTDYMTELPNRIALYHEIESAIGVDGESTQCALFYMDLDNFKFINDSFSHSAGDIVLVETGRRLQAALSENTVVSRLEGDEFVIFIKQFLDREELIEKIHLAMKIFDEPFLIKGSKIHVSASCGVSIFPEHAGCTDELLKNSDVAMYHAKKNGKNKYTIYEKSMNDEFLERIHMESGLRNALDNSEFCLHYQPQIALDTGHISSFEALIRWRSPQYGMVAPLKFISMAEETGLIIPIGKWVLREACIFINKLNNASGKSFGISVNVSVIQLLQSDFVKTVTEILDETGVDPALVELELTESRLMEAVGPNLQKLTELKKTGVKISIDDFGKGFSSLSYLKQLPIHSLKIDKSFIDDIPGDDSTMIESIIHIGHQRSLVVIAEGVEKQEQLEYLSRYGCDRVQGYYYSKPLPEENIYQLIEEQ